MELMRFGNENLDFNVQEQHSQMRSLAETISKTTLH